MAPRLVLTGGSSGIGATLALALHREWDVTVIDLTTPAAPVDGVSYLTADLTGQRDLDHAVARLTRGGSTIDALVHCAAIGAFGEFLTMPRATWERVLTVNLHGTLATVQALGPHLSDGARVVLFSSGTVFKGPAGAAAYAASKAGIIGFARCLADELGPRGITVNTIAPGLVRTPLSGSIAHTESANVATRAIKRASTTDDFVEPVRFLLSPGASFVTGQTLVVDGGSIRR